jgi:anhydro-N-acetylmuramic acid kinase
MWRGGREHPLFPWVKKCFGRLSLFLNIGGIANLSVNHSSGYLAYDVCPANRF